MTARDRKEHLSRVPGIKPGMQFDRLGKKGFDRCVAGVGLLARVIRQASIRLLVHPLGQTGPDGLGQLVEAGLAGLQLDLSPVVVDDDPAGPIFKVSLIPPPIARVGGIGDENNDRQGGAHQDQNLHPIHRRIIGGHNALEEIEETDHKAHG